jgi:DNA-binding MarR family transcriptional regulator
MDEDLIDISLRVPRAMVESAILAARHGVGGGVRDKTMLARTIVAGRRRRSQIFPRVRFGEPSWDMILELYLASCDGQGLDVTSLCQASGAPQTTALRYVEMLERQGLITREPDRADGRRIFVVPQESLRLQLEHWLDVEIAALEIATL